MNNLIPTNSSTGPQNTPPTPQVQQQGATKSSAQVPNNAVNAAPLPSNTKKSNAQDPNQSSRGLEYKNLIKEKILKPSKLPEYQALKKHHSHLVIRDSNYFNKNPSSFIACASCHRGRVLKISSIQETDTDDILNEIYSIIGVNPCSKKRAKSSANSDQLKKSKNVIVGSADSSSIPSSSSSNPLHYTNSLLNPPLSSTTIQTTTTLTPPIIPSFEDFFNDFDHPINLPSLNLKVPINSINSFSSITTASLLSIQKGETNFPTSLDLFLSLGISRNFPDFHNNDTLIIPLPCISNTKFTSTLDENIYLSDINLIESINTRISKFINQKPQVSLTTLKVIIIICSFQEGSPQNPQEDQSHKYVGKIIIISDFIVNELNNQLLYQTKKFFLNHDYTFIDSKFEWLQSQFLQKIIIKPLQKQLHSKYEYPVLGDVISSDVFLNNSMSMNVPFIMNSGFYQINHSTSLYIVCYLVLNVLRRFMNMNGHFDELNLMNHLNGIEYNNQFNVYVLRLVLDTLKNIQQ